MSLKASSSRLRRLETTRISPSMAQIEEGEKLGVSRAPRELESPLCARSGILRQAEMTSADLHDSQRGEAMIQGDETAYYGDKAYRLQGEARNAAARLAERANATMRATIVIFGSSPWR